jgi:hypothetical protein
MFRLEVRGFLFIHRVKVLLLIIIIIIPTNYQNSLQNRVRLTFIFSPRLNNFVFRYYHCKVKVFFSIYFMIPLFVYLLTLSTE